MSKRTCSTCVLFIVHCQEPDELENDGEKGVSSVITSQLEEGENEETQSSPVISSQIEEEGENKGAHNSSENLSRPEEKEKVLERVNSITQAY